MIAPYKIAYRDFFSIDFDCHVGLSFDGDDGDISTFLGKEAIYSESYNGSQRRVYGYKYNEVFTPQITFIKQDYSEFTMEENRRILSWLTGSHSPSWLTVYSDDSDTIAYEILGNFTSCSQYKLSNGQIIGYVCDFECVSPYAYSPIKTITKIINQPTTINLSCQSDEECSYVYPKITITQGDSVVVNIDETLASKIFRDDNYIDGTVYSYDNKYYWKDMTSPAGITRDVNDSGITTTSTVIINKTTNTKTYIKNRGRGEITIIDGANKVITTTNKSVIGDNFNWSWIPLAIGNNTIEIIGNCTVTVEYREPIKAGHV